VHEHLHVQHAQQPRDEREHSLEGDAGACAAQQTRAVEILLIRPLGNGGHTASAGRGLQVHPRVSKTTPNTLFFNRGLQWPRPQGIPDGNRMQTHARTIGVRRSFLWPFHSRHHRIVSQQRKPFELGAAADPHNKTDNAPQQDRSATINHLRPPATRVAVVFAPHAALCVETRNGPTHTGMRYEV